MGTGHLLVFPWPMGTHGVPGLVQRKLPRPILEPCNQCLSPGYTFQHTSFSFLRNRAIKGQLLFSPQRTVIPTEGRALSALSPSRASTLSQSLVSTCFSILRKETDSGEGLGRCLKIKFKIKQKIQPTWEELVFSTNFVPP